MPVCRLVGADGGGDARAGPRLPPAVAAAAPAFADLRDAQAFVRDAIAARVERAARQRVRVEAAGHVGGAAAEAQPAACQGGRNVAALCQPGLTGIFCRSCIESFEYFVEAERGHAAGCHLR